MPKISVIVPVYNVQDYLQSCIDSILAQSYTDFDLILVDDGSTDNSSYLCDEYAKIGGQIIVIHQYNKGLSAARNTGIEYAISHSDSCFLLFIDSDDAIKNNLFEKVINAQKKSNADIVCFGIEMVNEELEPLDWGSTTIEKDLLFEGECRFNALLPPENVGDYAVNKLYKKELFTNIRYPLGKTYEDIYTTYKVFDLSKLVYVIPDNLYLYRRRSGSITRSGNQNKIDFNYFLSNREKHLFIFAYTLNKNRVVAGMINFAGTSIIHIMNGTTQRQQEEYLSVIRSFILENWDFMYNNTICETDKYELCNNLRRGISSLRRFYKTKMRKTKIINYKYRIIEKLLSAKGKIMERRFTII